MIHWLEPGELPPRFPPVEQALREPNGLLAAGGELSLARLQAAYRFGIFPWYSAGEPILWWSPDPREVLEPRQFHCSRTLAALLKRGHFEWRANGDFGGVVAACAAPRAHSPGTWISAEMQAAYLALHAAGWAHSYECWRDGRLVGGLYGVRVGTVFCGESMFSRESNASKVALAGLVARAQQLGIELIDCQIPNAHLRSLGSRPMPRSQYLDFLHCNARDSYAESAPVTPN